MPLTTTEKFLEYTGINLNEELSAVITDDIGDQDPAPRFIESIESWCREWLVDHKDNPITLLDEDKELASTHQTTCFIKGVCYQISYYLRAGNLSNESGFIANQGIIATREILDKISMSPNALRIFRLGGLANEKRM